VTTVHAIVLGIVQGATEFLPVSSKTHLVVVPALLGWRSPSLEFVVWLHLGSLVALLGYFARDIAGMLTDREDGWRTIGLLVLASVPAVIVGLVFEETFDRLLRHARAAGIALGATAVILVVAELAAGTVGSRLPKSLRDRPTVRDAVTMGLAQCVAFLPGVSRSGSTMAAGLSMGLQRAAAARFSFLMALVAIAGASVLEAPEILRGGLGTPAVAGFVASLVTSYVVIAALLRYLRRHNFLPFASYCVALAVVAAVRLG
jgi:undecaprenyl-diphosphatase